jgi:spore coat polysaccharide biosynthesis protein SpsF
VVRITADDPFKDPQVIDQVVARFLATTLDYASNTIVPTYPEGLDVEVFRFSSLRRSWQEAALPSEREHVTPYIWKNPDRFSIMNVANDQNLSALRWTIDYEEDLLFAREIYSRLDSGLFLMADILDLLQREPHIVNEVKDMARNHSYLKSLQEDTGT